MDSAVLLISGAPSTPTGSRGRSASTVSSKPKAWRWDRGNSIRRSTRSMTRWSARCRPRCPSKTPCSAWPTAWRRRSVPRTRRWGPAWPRALSEARACFEANAPVLERLAQRHRLGIVSNFYGNLPTVCDNADVRRYFWRHRRLCAGRVLEARSAHFPCRGRDAGRQAWSHRHGGRLTGPGHGGARAAGMAHIWLAPHPARQGPPCCQEDRVIQSLAQVEELLP